MEREYSELHAAFCEAYPLYVARVLVGRGVEVGDVIADAIVEGTAILGDLLSHLEDTDPTDQRSSPLELFRQALRPVDAALATIGVPAPSADAGHETVHPWDRYQLCPGSPQLLGERAYDAHVRWGVAKAIAFGAFGNPSDVQQVDAQTRRPERPAIQVICDETDTAHFGALLRGLGYRLVDAGSERSVVTIVDIDHGGAARAISDTVATHGRVVVYGDAIDDLQAMAFSAAGVWKVVSRSDILTRLDTVLPAIG
ncbi:MAG: hypothetical protein O3B42_06520 [Actinomycetota bacterium]|nr:hypothetical protein [Actinomycetota bacterium]